MKRTMLAIAASMYALAAPVKPWGPSEISPLLFVDNRHPVSRGKTGVAASRRAAKKRRRAR